MHLKVLCISLLICLLLGWTAVFAQASPAIETPAGGEALQGIAVITGSSAVQDFQAAELSFSYAAKAEDGWFLIDWRDEPVVSGELGSWDTTTIADETYRLRLRVYLKDGSTQDAFVEGVRVRNYTPVETNTPQVMQPGRTDQPSGTVETAVPTPAPAGLLPTPTLIPENPARLTQKTLTQSMARGAVMTGLLFITFGIYAGIRALLRGR